MNTREALQSQYLAALAMLRQAVMQCPAHLWDAPEDAFKFWSKAYHTLYFAHLYLQDAEKDFVPWEKHHDPDGGEPFTQAEVLAYLDVVEKHVVERVGLLNLDSPDSGFHWYPISKFEMQLVNIRHIQQHAGELFEYLGIRAGAQLRWVGARHQ